MMSKELKLNINGRALVIKCGNEERTVAKCPSEDFDQLDQWFSDCDHLIEGWDYVNDINNEKKSFFDALAKLKLDLESVKSEQTPSLSKISDICKSVSEIEIHQLHITIDSINAQLERSKSMSLLLKNALLTRFEGDSKAMNEYLSSLLKK